MFLRDVNLRHGNRSYRYLQLVESSWKAGKVHQRVVANLGRLDQLLAAGTLGKVTAQLAEHCPNLTLLEVPADNGVTVGKTQRLGPVLALELLWRENGWKAGFERLATQSGLPSLEPVAFALVLHRLLGSNGKLPDVDWITGVRAEGFNDLQAADFIQALGALGRGRAEVGHSRWLVGEPIGGAAESPSLRCWIPASVAIRLVDRRPDAKAQVIRATCVWEVEMGLRGDGTPLVAKASPGRGRSRWDSFLQQLQAQTDCVELLSVGRLTPAIRSTLERSRLRYIVGCRVRGLEQKGESSSVGGRSAWEEVLGWRLVKWFDEDQAERDRRHRQATLEGLIARQGRGVTRGMRQNVNFCRYGRADLDQVEIDEEKVRADELLDGCYVLRTNTELGEQAVAEAFEHYLWAQRIWTAPIPVSGELPAVLEPRTEYWPQVGHLHACYAACSLGTALKQQVKQAGFSFPWGKIIRDLNQVWAVEIKLEEATCLMRGSLQGCAKQVLEAAGAIIPPQIQVFEQSLGS